MDGFLHAWFAINHLQPFQLYPVVSEVIDPIPLFAIMVAQIAVIYLCKIMESLTWEVEEHYAIVIEYQKRALWAARERARLSKAPGQHSYFKAS
jgi:hypothetical protein